MLDKMRSAATGWIAYIFIGLLVISFAVWGISDIFTGFRSDTVATVGGTEIETSDFVRQYQVTLQNAGQQMGRPLTPEQAQLFGIPAQVLGGLVTQATLDDTARQYGLGLSNEDLAKKIGEDPAFRGPGGGFDRLTFTQILRANGFTEDQYVQDRHAVYLRYQLTDALAGGTATPETYLRALEEYRNEKRDVRYVTIAAEQAEPVGEPTDQQLNVYFGDNKAQWRAPEFRAVSYFELHPEDLAKPEDISDEDARAHYDANIKQYSTLERRRVSQIHFDTKDEADAAAAELAQGKTFDEIAQERNLSQSDLDLGLLTRDEIVDPAISEAAYSLDSGAVSSVVETAFGYVIIRVEEIQAGTEKPFEEVRDEIKKDMAVRQAASDMVHAYDQVEDLRAGGETLAEIAPKMKATLKQVAAVDSAGNDADGNKIADLPGGSALLTAIFDTDVGMENDSIRTQDNGYIWYEVTAVTAERDRELNEVRDRVVEAWKKAETAKNIAAKAEELRKRIDGGETLDAVAAPLGLTVQSATGLTRLGQPPAGLTPDALNTVFAGPEGHVGIAAGTPAENRVLLVVDRVDVPAFDPNTAGLADIRQQISSQLANDFLQQYLVEMQSRLGVSVNQAALQAAIGQRPAL